MMPKRQRPRRPRPKAEPKPTPKPVREWVEGRDYWCGCCIGHKLVPCDYCVDGCPHCKGVGKVACPVCNGGTVPTPPPQW